MARAAHDDDANLQDVHPDGVTLSSGEEQWWKLFDRKPVEWEGKGEWGTVKWQLHAKHP